MIKPLINAESSAMLDTCCNTLKELLEGRNYLLGQGSVCYADVVEIHKAINQQVNIVKAVIEVGLDYPIK